MKLTENDNDIVMSNYAICEIQIMQRKKNSKYMITFLIKDIFFKGLITRHPHIYLECAQMQE